MAVSRGSYIRSQAAGLQDGARAIRATLGHSGAIRRQMISHTAFQRIGPRSGVLVSNHAARFDLLPSIIGFGAQALVLGGETPTEAYKTNPRSLLIIRAKQSSNCIVASA